MSEYLESLFSLKGKRALVTGGAKGIGLMISEALAKAGAEVIIASRSQEDCEKVAAELSQYSPCKGYGADLGSVEGIEGLAEKIAADSGKLDILFNNSGTTWGAPIDSYPGDKWDRVMNLNVKSPFYLIQKLLPLLRNAADKEDPARIINISSTAGLTSETLAAYAYQASKAAVIHMTRGIARDLAKENITVNSIAPGYFPSKMTKHIHSDEKILEQVLEKIPLRRMGTARDMGALAVFLSSGSSSFITGETIVIDGGVVVG